MNRSGDTYQEEKIGKAYDTVLMSRLLSYLKPYLLSFFGSLFLALLATGTELGLPYIVKQVIDEFIVPLVKQTGVVTQQQALQGIAWWSGIYIAVLFARFLCMYGQNILLYYAGQKAMRDMRKQVFEKLLRLPISYFHRNPIGRLVTRATNDVEAIHEMYSEVLVSLFKELLMVVGLLVVMFVLDWKLTLYVLVLAPVAYWIGNVFRNKVRDAYRAVRRKVAELNAYVAEHISGMRMIQLFAQEDRSRDEFASFNDDEFQARMKQLKIYGVFRPLVQLMRILATALVLWFGGLRVIDSPFTLGSLVLFLSYIEKLFEPIQQLAQKYDVLQKAMASSERIFQVLDESDETYDGLTMPSRDRTGEMGRRIEFQDVWFSYEEDPGEEDWVLRDLSFVVQPGERIALVGRTGVGKTTIIKLLLRWHDVNRGRILLDGVDIRELDLQKLRSTIGVVMQDVFLFSGDVKSNLRLWSEEISEASLKETARDVRAHELITRLPEGYETSIQQGGDQFSEGQRQLIAFTRALSADPDVLVLDEATSSIDSRTERRILSAMDRMLSDRTSITIAHRLSTVENSDRILVIDHGEIVEQGTHEELLEKDGLYASLCKLQF